MTNAALEQKYRLSTARFADDVDGKTILVGLGRHAREVTELLVLAFGQDIGLMPRDLDREHVKQLMLDVLPGRVEGNEGYAKLVPDVAEAYLRFLCFDEGLASSWELTSAVEENRAGYLARLKDASRRRLGSSAKSTPDVRPAPKIGRNDPCFCGSGKKYKQCCLKLLGG